ncbi:MAG: NUDIX domain-containing protein [Candidatus Omnitrophica bacterium]|nr:NUDIX domain-containing protein [Candidatus Omnitrophota bacterium]
MKKHLDVVAALIIKDNKMLLCQRKAEDAYPLFWEFPGGCLEKGETLAEAIEREIDEELGVRVKAEKIMHTFHDEDPDLYITVYLYECLNMCTEPYAKDCKDLGLFSVSQAEQLNLAPVDRKMLNYLKTSVFL